MIQMTLHDMSERRKKVAEFCRQCKLQFPRRWPSSSRPTPSGSGSTSASAPSMSSTATPRWCTAATGTAWAPRPSVAATLSTIRSFPDQTVEFVDIFAEGNEEDGYSFGQCTQFLLAQHRLDRLRPSHRQVSGRGRQKVFLHVRVPGGEGRGPLAHHRGVAGPQPRRSAGRSDALPARRTGRAGITLSGFSAPLRRQNAPAA